MISAGCRNRKTPFTTLTPYSPPPSSPPATCSPSTIFRQSRLRASPVRSHCFTSAVPSTSYRTLFSYITINPLLSLPVVRACILGQYLCNHDNNTVMMLQHSGPSLADISCSALVPCLSPPGTLTLDDFTNFTPIVKDELRLAIQTKRLSNGLSVDMSSDGASSSSDRASEHLACGSGVRREVTPQEHERRKRRRERNKIAAAKCRNKKKEKTETLQKESEKLESVNADLKAQIEELKHQKQQLVYMLNLHRPTCIVRAQNGQTPEDERNLFIQHIKESTLQLHNLTSSTTTSAAATTTSISTVAPLDGGFLTLDHIQCPSHL
ncbi:Cyclic AMP-dependent transcription factor ATF-3 [Collichthys lucidus]|uniref:Cyclic AMP-dependent transcription factor ATF-3 n=1 Tax=Collichthys lucidus TaxID=240159 RepID=A0A4U5UMC1_COLLU|nr:Cyclic AMP-dependent transcription factor ATF-3 [Collichthys lucidus]